MTDQAVPPAKHGTGGVSAVFHEVPTWGWWVMGIGGLVVVYVRYRQAAAGTTTTTAGAATTAADVTAGGAPSMGDIVGLNNLMVQSETLSNQQFTQLQAELAALLARGPVPGPTGPAGPTGPSGPTGASGPAGATGSGGVNVITGGGGDTHAPPPTPPTSYWTVTSGGAGNLPTIAYGGQARPLASNRGFFQQQGMNIDPLLLFGLIGDYRYNPHDQTVSYGANYATTRPAVSFLGPGPVQAQPGAGH